MGVRSCSLKLTLNLPTALNHLSYCEAAIDFKWIRDDKEAVAANLKHNVCVPNMTHPDVSVGGEDCYTLRKVVGKPREFGFTIKDRVQLGNDLDIIDFDASSLERKDWKLVLIDINCFLEIVDSQVLLETVFVNWALSEVMKRGFTPLTTPEIVRSSILEKSGFRPHGTNTQPRFQWGESIWIPYLPRHPLPLKYVLSPIASAQKLVLLALRLGAFTESSKVEMFVLCRPEESDSLHEELISIETSSHRWDFTFKAMDMATGDLGAPVNRKFDVEAWMPGLGRYGEISSASNCTDYQSRRLGIRYRPGLSTPSKKGKGGWHKVNATHRVLFRMLVCLLENYHQEDGTVVIPEPLQPFVGVLQVIDYNFR
ncbi:hypothetical protein SASPL_128751 [Salvia splendens]|uniref:Aminoacyl-tRNA synthetase class II (G/ P/ S/T) domain-containing protein n=1 Tax=Salvia splendens TaxID=180675 RepID=A0A8X8XFV3_SALSN|nr:hypothetical protein SASPL_128751 [Salvia splendens]